MKTMRCSQMIQLPYHSDVVFFPRRRNPNIVQTVTTASPETPQIADIITIQMLYGKPESANPGDTIYGVGANTGTYLGRDIRQLDRA